jgi:GGDEF domain-containing protein
MSGDRRGSIATLDALRGERLAAIEGVCARLREAVGVTAHRVWFCPFSGDELIELTASFDAVEGRRVRFAASAEQLRDGPLVELTLLHRTFDGMHPRWDTVVRDLVEAGPADAPLWEADLCQDADPEAPERVGVVTLFDRTGRGAVAEDLTSATRATVRELLRELALEVDAYRQARYHIEVLGTLQPRIAEELARAGGPPDAADFFEGIAAWFRRVALAGLETSVSADVEQGPSAFGNEVVSPNVCVLFIKEENRLVQVDATDDYKRATMLATDGVADNPLTRVPLDGGDGLLLAFAYEVMSREHQPLLFPSGRSDGAYIASLLEDLRQRLRGPGSAEAEDEEDPDGAPLSPAGARAGLRTLFQHVKHAGSVGFFPLMRREEVEGVFVMLACRRPFFYPINTLLARAIASRLGRLPELLPDHRQDKDYRDRKTRLIYTEQRHQHLDRYLTGGQRLQAVAFLDLGGFRELNDVYGHRVGDKVLESMMEGLAVAAHRPELLVDRHAALQLVEQERQKLEAEQYAATEISKKRRRKTLRLLPLHYGGDEFGLALLGKDEGEEVKLVERCVRVVVDLLGYLRFRVAGQVDASRLRLHAALALPSALEGEGGEQTNDFALYTALRDLGRTLMYYAKGIEEVPLYCPGHTVLEHRFELELDEGGPGVWRAVLISPRSGGERVPMSGDVLQLDLLQSLDRTVGRHIRSGEDRDAVVRRIQKTMKPVRFEVLARLPGVGTRGAGGRGVRDQYLVRQLDLDTGAVRVTAGDHLFGHVLV